MTWVSGLKQIRPTYAEINLTNIKRNLHCLRQIVSSERQIMAVLKANAYGHGAGVVSKFLEEENLCESFGVATVEEGIFLKEKGIKKPILVFGSIYPYSCLKDALESDLRVSIASLDSAKELVKIAESKDKVFCHVKIDTGMGRLGAKPESSIEIFKTLANSKNIVIEGTYTTLSSSGIDNDFSKHQIRLYNDVIENCKKLNIQTGIKHVANTVSLLNIPESKMEMIRPGAGVYGLIGDFFPAMSVKSKIVFVKDLEKGASISYNRSFRCTKQTRVATIPIGYADGYLRAFTDKAYVLINGKKCKVLGNVNMDMIMADISDAPGAMPGTDVLCMGGELPMIELASLIGTIPYELSSLVSPRVPRVYIKE
jgi:alanine racemase